MEKLSRSGKYDLVVLGEGDSMGIFPSKLIESELGFSTYATLCRFHSWMNFKCHILVHVRHVVFGGGTMHVSVKFPHVSVIQIHKTAGCSTHIQKRGDYWRTREGEDEKGGGR